MFERILAPLDGSMTAEAILPHLRRFSARHQSEIILVKVLSVPLGAEPIDAPVVLSDLLQDAEGYLREHVEKFREDGINARWVVRVGPAAETIVDLAAEEGVSLIALTTHGRSGLARWLLGSVSEKVVRASRVPVYLVRSFAKAAEEPKAKWILVPLDGTAAAAEILPNARELALVLGAGLMALQVIEGREPAPLEELPDPLPALEVAELARAGISVVTVVRTGDPAAEILATCKDHPIALIAMSRHRRSGLARWFLGSVVEKVLRAAPIPMFIFPASAASRAGEPSGHAAVTEADSPRRR